MKKFEKYTIEETRGIISDCFEYTNRLDDIETLSDWLKAFLKLLDARCWAISDEFKKKKREREIIINKGCTDAQHAMDVATKAKQMRMKRFHEFINEAIAIGDVKALEELSAKYKSICLTEDEFNGLNLHKRGELTKQETEAIYMWKFAKDGQFEKDRVNKYRNTLIEMGFFK